MLRSTARGASSLNRAGRAFRRDRPILNCVIDARNPEADLKRFHVGPFPKAFSLAYTAQRGSGEGYRRKNGDRAVISNHYLHDSSDTREQEGNGAVPEHQPDGTKTTYLERSILIACLRSGQEKLQVGLHIRTVSRTWHQTNEFLSNVHIVDRLPEPQPTIQSCRQRLCYVAKHVTSNEDPPYQDQAWDTL